MLAHHHCTFGAHLYLNLKNDALLENTGALTQPSAVIAVLPFSSVISEDASVGARFTNEISDRLAKHPDLYVVSSQATY
ncbi:MAG: hypothetical protein VB957_18995 [Pseudomonadales bacterium]